MRGSYQIEFVQEKRAESAFILWQDCVNHSSEPLSGSWTECKLEKEFRCGQGLVAVDDQGRLAAFLLFRKAPDVADIILLATHPAHRRQGLMRLMLSRLIEESQWVKEVWLEVHEENKRAQEFYRCLGFEVTGWRENYYGPDQAGVLMTLKTPR